MFLESSRPLLLGHRGAPKLAPENTLESFEAALSAGADGVELDLQLTFDDELVVHHDSDVGGRAISELASAEFRALAPHAPTFAQLLDLLAAWPEAYLNIELKPAVPRPDGREVALAKALAGWDAQGKARAWVSSFDPHALLRLGRLAVGTPLALLAADEVHLELLPCLTVAAVHPHYDLVDEGTMAAWRKAGLAVFAWTVNDQALAKKLLELGVSGLIGDEPSKLLAARAGTAP